MSTQLSEFFRGAPPARADTSSRVTAGLLTAGLYALFALLVWRASLAPPSSPVASEIVATLLPDRPKKRAVEKKGDVKLLMPNQTVYNVLSMLSLHLIFDIHQDEAKAVRAFAS